MKHPGYASSRKSPRPFSVSALEGTLDTIVPLSFFMLRNCSCVTGILNFKTSLLIILAAFATFFQFAIAGSLTVESYSNWTPQEQQIQVMGKV